MNRHILAALAAALLASQAGMATAQLYKWVDERGRVNYSNQLPVDAKSASQAAVVEDRVSVYSPDATLVREIEADRQRADRGGREPEAYRPAVAMIGGAAPAPAAMTVIETPVYEHPYVVVGGYRKQRPLHKVPQVALRPGAIAGATVGLNSIMPGSSAPVPGTWSPVAPQPPSHPRPAPFKRHSWER